MQQESQKAVSARPQPDENLSIAVSLVSLLDQPPLLHSGGLCRGGIIPNVVSFITMHYIRNFRGMVLDSNKFPTSG
jgi:hypothetical protein